MKELKDIVNAFHSARRLNKRTAIATVVHVDGSSYRRAGARMLITEDGQLMGAISGGCLEGDALRKARLVIIQQKPMLVIYDTNDEDDAKLGVQLGCNGVIHILIEPIDAECPHNPIRFFEQYLSKREPVVLLTFFNMVCRHEPQAGTCLLINYDGQTTGSLPDSVNVDILTDAIELLEAKNSFSKIYRNQDHITCLIELLQPVVSLIIIGAGNDAMPLVQMSKLLGWQVTLVDGRPNYNTAERFPAADKRVISKPEEVLSNVQTDSQTAFMLMTHNYNYDLELLRHLIPLNLPYIGVLGPKKRIDRILDEISADCENQLNTSHIHGPAGLDIGSENAEQIALSILAEIQSVFSNLSGAPLKNKPTIHGRVSEFSQQPAWWTNL